MLCEAGEWSDWYEHAGNDRIVKQETLPNGLFVSTVFLGLDYSYDENNPKPILFETMVFGGSSQLHEERDSERCSTWEEAEEMHRKMCEKHAQALSTKE